MFNIWAESPDMSPKDASMHAHFLSLSLFSSLSCMATSLWNFSTVIFSFTLKHQNTVSRNKFQCQLWFPSSKFRRWVSRPKTVYFFVLFCQWFGHGSEQGNKGKGHIEKIPSSFAWSWVIPACSTDHKRRSDFGTLNFFLEEPLTLHWGGQLPSTAACSA